MSIRTAADTFAPRLPKTIRAVQARLAISPELWALPQPALRLAQIIASYTPLGRLHLAVGFNRKTPATVLGCSIRSIDRHLSTLVRFGLVERMKQKKHGATEWDCTRIKWTNQAIKVFFKPMIIPATVNASPALSDEALDGTDNGQPQCATNMAYKSRATPLGKPSKVSIENKSASGTALNEQEIEKLGQHQEQHDITNPIIVPALVILDVGQSQTTPRQSSKNVTLEDKRLHGDLSRLPADLIEPAKTLGLKRGDMVYLMSLCKKVGQSIQDVLAVVQADLSQKGLQGRSVVAWLTPVIHSGRDFKWIAKSAHKDRRARVLKARRQAIVDKMVTIITTAQQLVLPGGSVALESTCKITTIRSSKGRVSSIPTVQLAEACLRRSLAWSKNSLRGVIEKPPVTLSVHQRTTVPAPQEAPSTRSTAGMSELKKMMSILKTSPGFVHIPRMA